MGDRGLPLLSGPPPTPRNSRADIGCRKCSKEFNVLFHRSRKCNHCGYAYCQNCTDFQALMPREGADAGYDPMPVCGFCIENLSITAARRGALRTLPLAKLKKYIAAYNLNSRSAVEKDDLIDAIISARGPNGCLPPANENFYRTYSVPDRIDYSRPRGLFSRQAAGTSVPPPPVPPRPQTGPRPEFARPDLAPDDMPPPLTRSPPVPPRPEQPRFNPQAPVAPHYHAGPHPHYNPQYFNPSQQQPFHVPRPMAPPTPAQNSRPRPSQPYQQPSASRSSNNLRAENVDNRQTPRPRAASSHVTSSPAPPIVPPTLDQLITMSPESIRALSIGNLKAILFTNHVNATMILEKEELVKKVTDLIEAEKRDRERQRLAEEQEEQDRIAQQHAMMEEHERRMRERRNAESEASSEPAPSTSPGMPSSPPKPAAPVERSGLCVVCQDEVANIAIVDCGHLAMCRGCSELVMSSSRECPLCRTRIVTEARLLRIFTT
ncbi:hypothetical protein C8J56DRAFT_1015258 [Mycena floridula]|nr:hypothetical protein C8J56DRAFT_1015258 [Mycena floridula]